MNRDDLLLQAVKCCIIREPFTSHSGLRLDWQCDLLQSLGSYEDYVKALAPSTTLAGIELGGYILARASGWGAILVRKDGSVYYPFSKPLQVSLLDDVVTTGRSMQEAECALAKHGIKVYERLCVLDRRSEVPGHADMELNIRSLFTSEDVVDKVMTWAKYREKSAAVEAIQFSYIDGIYGPETCKLAGSLGLTRDKGRLSLWEFASIGYWGVVRDGDWIIVDAKGERYVCGSSLFRDKYELMDKQAE